MGQPINHSQEINPGVPRFPKEHKFEHKLEPPPYTLEDASNSIHDFQIPLPPCAFHPPNYKTFSKKGLIRMQDHDPFFAAYKKCTKNTSSVERNNKLQMKTRIETRLRNSISFISCKRSCSVRDNNLVRISHLPHDVDKD